MYYFFSLLPLLLVFVAQLFLFAMASAFITNSVPSRGLFTHWEMQYWLIAVLVWGVLAFACRSYFSKHNAALIVWGWALAATVLLFTVGVEKPISQLVTGTLYNVRLNDFVKTHGFSGDDEHYLVENLHQEWYVVSKDYMYPVGKRHGNRLEVGDSDLVSSDWFSRFLDKDGKNIFARYSVVFNPALDSSNPFNPARDNISYYYDDFWEISGRPPLHKSDYFSR